MTFNSIEWGNYWGAGFDLVGGGEASWEASYGLIASSTYTLLSGLPPLYRDPKPGWLPVGNEIEGSVTGINTNINKDDRMVETISVQNSLVQDIFNHLRENGTEEYYKVSFGWQGDINITVPHLTTICTAGLPVDLDVPIGTMPVRTFPLLPLAETNFSQLTKTIDTNPHHNHNKHPHRRYPPLKLHRRNLHSNIPTIPLPNLNLDSKNGHYLHLSKLLR